MPWNYRQTLESTATVPDTAPLTTPLHRLRLTAAMTEILRAARDFARLPEGHGFSSFLLLDVPRCSDRFINSTVLFDSEQRTL
jgi:hypothetical protein